MADKYKWEVTGTVVNRAGQNSAAGWRIIDKATGKVVKTITYIDK